MACVKPEAVAARSRPVDDQRQPRCAASQGDASYVVLYDPWWNPAVEAQAIDRSHRIGQTRTVNAYRLISPGTVEEKIWELQQSKAQTIADVLGEEGFARSLSKADLEYLFAED